MCECEWRGKLIKEAMKGGSVEVREEGVRGAIVVEWGEEIEKDERYKRETWGLFL